MEQWWGRSLPTSHAHPTDARAPVQWNIFPSTHTFEDFDVEFLPMGLNHTVRFPPYYEQLPSRTVAFTCDLINVEEPGVGVDPQQTTVRFVQSKLSTAVHVQDYVFTYTCAHMSMCKITTNCNL